MFERFTSAALDANRLAEDEARRMLRDEVGPEHLLLGLVGENNGLAWQALMEVGVTLADARAASLALCEKGSTRSEGTLLLTESARQIIVLARNLVFFFGDPHISSEHILLGLIYEKNLSAYAVLDSLHVDFERLYKLLLYYRGQANSSFWDRLPSRDVALDDLILKSGRAPVDVAPTTVSEHSRMSHMADLWGLNEWAKPAVEPSVSDETRKCPNCAERILAAANICRFCFYGLSDKHFFACPFCAERIRLNATKCRFCMNAIEAACGS